MPARVYVETTVVSYLTAWPSNDPVRDGHQSITREWWDDRPGDFELVTSQVVLREAGAGDASAAAERLSALAALPLLDVTEAVEDFALQLAEELQLPERAGADAIHIAIAAVHGVEYLLTWNCRHIANAVLRPRIEDTCRRHGYEPPIICTPEELNQEDQDVS